MISLHNAIARLP